MEMNLGKLTTFSEEIKMQESQPIIQVTLPIPNYYNDDVFYQELYFYGFPSQEEVKAELTRRHEEDSQHPSYLNCWKFCLEALEGCERWPTWSGTLVQTNTFTTIEKYGRKPVSFKKIKVVEKGN